MSKSMDQEIAEFNAALERAKTAKPGESLDEEELAALLVEISRAAPSSKWFLHIARALLERFQVRAVIPFSDDVWLQTFLGFRMVLPSFEGPNGSLDHITLTETAAVLSRICRFGARTVPADRIYSVAEHSVRVAECVRAMGGTPQEVWEAINHEGDEALLGFDPPAPLLRVCPDLRDIKHRAGSAYNRRYSLPAELSPLVKKADLILLATEKRDVMAPCVHDWGKLPPTLKRRITPWVNPFARFIACWRAAAKAVGYEGKE